MTPKMQGVPIAESKGDLALLLINFHGHGQGQHVNINIRKKLTNNGGWL
jgi:hypothetical protein